jgi:hypothetical protein
VSEQAVEHVYWASVDRGQEGFDPDRDDDKELVTVVGDGNPLLLTDLWDDDSVRAVHVHGFGTMDRDQRDQAES